MAGTHSTYIEEMFERFQYFRTCVNTPTTIQSRPVENDKVMMEYITGRWTTNNQISRALQIDNIFMAVSIQLFNPINLMLIDSC